LKLQGSAQRESTSSLVDIFFKAKELERQGFDVIHFDAGEPDFAPPQEVVEATVKALREGHARYAQSAGIPQTRKAIADSLNSKHQSNITPEQVILTAGGRLALYYTFMSLSRETKVGIFSPDWPAYRDICNFLQLPIRFFTSSLEKRWEIDPDEVRRSGCGALVLNYPNNPTGKVLDLKTLEEIIEIARQKQMIVISDEVYSDYVFDVSRRYKSILETDLPNKIFVTSMSKSYAMTGFRAAYVISDRATISRMVKLNTMIITSMPEFVQYGMLAALDCKGYVSDKVELIRKRREVITKALKKYLDAEFYSPDGAMYIFPRLRSKKSEENFNSEKFALELLEKQKVSVTPGTAFGSAFPDHIRMTLLQSESRIEEGIERMSKIL